MNIHWLPRSNIDIVSKDTHKCREISWIQVECVEKPSRPDSRYRVIYNNKLYLGILRTKECHNLDNIVRLVL